MYVPALLNELRQRNITLFLDDGALRYKAPPGALLPQDIERLRQHREAILLYLRASAACIRDPLPAEPPTSPRASFTQQMLWDWVSRTDPPLLFELLSLAVRGRATPEVAEAAVKALVARYEALRSYFVTTEGQLEVRLRAPDDFEVEHFAAPPGADGEAYVKEAGRAFFATRLAISSPWLMRAAVVELGEGRVAVLFQFHHGVIDGLTLKVLHEEMSWLLAHPPQAWDGMEAVALQSTAYVAWERGWFERNGGDMLRFWAGQLEGVEPIRHPRTGASLVWQPGLRQEFAFAIDPAMAQDIARYRQAHAVPALILFLGVFGLALARWSGQPRFAMRTIGDLRSTLPAGDIVGYMVCSDIVRFDGAAGASVADTIEPLTAEYELAARFRLPSLTRLPAHPDMPEGLEVSFLTTATVNYVNIGANKTIFANDQSATDAPFRAACAQVVPYRDGEPWPVPLWPVYLRMSESEGELFGKVEFNGSQIEPDLQRALIAQFFDLLSEQVSGAYA